MVAEQNATQMIEQMNNVWNVQTAIFIGIIALIIIVLLLIKFYFSQKSQR